MPRDDESGEDEPRSAPASRTVGRVGHAQSGGHNTGRGGRPKPNQIFQDPNDDDGGGDRPYVFVEYPKHVTIDGKTHIARDQTHEAHLKAKGS